MMDWREIPSLSALRAFEASARLESHSAASRELNVTHAAVAQHVRTLESHFGLTLMERSGRGMATTPAGRQLAEALARGFGEIAAGVRAVDAARGAGPLSITTTRTFAENWLMPRLAGFWAAHPEIHLAISADDTVADLRRAGHHLAIRYGRGNWPGLEVTGLTSANTIVVASPALAARLPGDFDPAAPDAVRRLADLPWLLDSRFGEFQSWLAASGLRLEELQTTELDGNALVLAGTRGGAGLSMQPKAVVAADIASGRLIKIVERDDPTLCYYLVTPPGPVADRVRVFTRWLLKAIEA